MMVADGKRGSFTVLRTKGREINLGKNLNALLLPSSGWYMFNDTAPREGRIWQINTTAGMVFQPDNQVVCQ